MKKFISMAILIALGVTLIPNLAGAAPNVLKGANADLDYVYMDEDVTISYTDEAEAHDQDALDVFPDDDGEKQYLYMGSKSQFDRLYFDVIRTAKYEDNDDGLEWEYYEDGSWRDLDVSDGALDGFTNKGAHSVSFDIPDDWDKVTYQNKSAYWVRVQPEDEVDRPARVEQISVRTYNLGLDVEDEDNDEVDDLIRKDFDVDNGSIDTIYGFINRGDGEYWFALNAEASDTSYKLTIDDARYDEETITISSLDTSLDHYSVELDEKSKKSSNNDHKKNNDYKIYLSSNDTPFRDLDDFWWAEDAIEDLYNRGVVEGRSYYYYYPEEDVTRAEFLKMILLSAEIDIDDYDHVDEDFRDVSSYAWYYEYVLAALDLDIIDDDYYFHPNTSINRAEAVTMLVRLEDELNNIDLDDDSTPFYDVSRYDWFAEYVAYAYDEGVVEGRSYRYFAPDAKLNRAEAAVLADRAYDLWWD